MVLRGWQQHVPPAGVTFSPPVWVTLCIHPTTVWKSRGLDGSRMWHREALLCPGPSRMLKNQQWRKFCRRMDGCVGVWVVLWWVSSPHIKNVSSPRFWPSVQACMSLCGFPAVSSHSSKNMHTEKLPSGCECLSCDELDLMSQCIWAHTCVHLPLYHRYSLCTAKQCTLKTPVQTRPQMTYFNVVQTAQLWHRTLRKPIAPFAPQPRLLLTARHVTLCVCRHA